MQIPATTADNCTAIGKQKILGSGLIRYYDWLASICVVICCTEVVRGLTRHISQSLLKTSLGNYTNIIMQFIKLHELINDIDTYTYYQHYDLPVSICLS